MMVWKETPFSFAHVAGCYDVGRPGCAPGCGGYLFQIDYLAGDENFRMDYPTMIAVEVADRVQLLRWSRYLSSPDEHQRPIMDRICKRQQESGGVTPALSKAVGWWYELKK